MSALRYLLACAVLVPFLLCGCGAPHGRPHEGSETIAPNEISDFATLYSQNCAGCHGAEGRGGAAVGIGDAVYLTIADDETIRKVVSKGERGTSMPAFAASAGGMLTDKQIEVITKGIRARWSKQGILDGVAVPAYAAKSAGDAGRGEIVYKAYCESCHGANGRGGKKGSAITDDSFLALVSDQSLRTMVIVGRPELGAPDWRGNVAGKPMSEQELTDVVAWLGAQRSQNPGQPYSATSNAQH